MTQESHSEYMDRKLAKAREIARAEGRISIAEAKRTAESERIKSLSPEQRALEKHERKIRQQGAHTATENLLGWTNGTCSAALASRYKQALRINSKKLTLDEVGEAISVVGELISAFSSSPNQLSRLKVIRLELTQQSARAKKEIQAQQVKAKKALGAIRNTISNNIDKGFAAGLTAAIKEARNSTGGYVYLKQWTLMDGTRWLKVGITSNPNRRDTEQNVLPVPVVTLRLMETQSMDQAAAIERALHQQLAAQKVTGAGNRELFHLDDAQLAALIAAMDS